MIQAHWRLNQLGAAYAFNSTHAGAGTIALQAIMNATYTYIAYYSADIPGSVSGPPVTVDAIEFTEPQTQQADARAAVRLVAMLPLLCDASNATAVRFESDEDVASFPILRPTQAMYRPDDVCSWDIVQPGADGLHASTNVRWMSRQAALAFTASREVDVSEVSSANRLLIGNTGDDVASGHGTGLQV
jgi:hypothetical protein